MEDLTHLENAQLPKQVGCLLLHAGAYVRGGYAEDWFIHDGKYYDIKISRGEITRVRKREQYIKRSGFSGRKYYRFKNILGEKRQEIIDAFIQQRKLGAA